MEFQRRDSQREGNVYFAKLVDQAERYDEKIEAMKKTARLDMELTAEERNSVSAGYKKVIGSRWASWRIDSAIGKDEEALKIDDGRTAASLEENILQNGQKADEH